MCGISVLISLNSSYLNFIENMNDVISYRGPDDEGFCFIDTNNLASFPFNGKDTSKDVYNASYRYTTSKKYTGETLDNCQIALGHRRLSIIDLSPAGHQPMSTIDGNNWIVFNGEIYNYLELKTVLQEKGYEFKTSSDTEVIMAAYDYWGTDCLKYFNGMWSFVLVDLKKKKIFASRDRFGVKPLYYWISPKGFISFASEIKQFTVLPGWEAKLNGQRAYDFLRWSMLDHTSETLFQNVFQLRGGSFTEFDFSEIEKIVASNSLKVNKWYDLPEIPFKGTLEEASKIFKELFADSIKLRLRSDVSVGSCLSGGLDSSSIVCMSNKILNENKSTNIQKTFSAYSHEKKFDEREFIEEAIKDKNIESYKVFPEVDDLFKIIDKLTWIQDEPFGSTSIFAQWSVFKLAADNNIKVMLDGQGADEQLAGYFNFFSPLLTSLFKGANLFRLTKEFYSIRNIHSFSYSSFIKLLAYNAIPESLVKQLRKKFSNTPDASNFIDLEKIGAKDINPVHNLGLKFDSIKALSYSQLMATNLQMLLHWEDRDSMAHSIESRLPFLDYRLVEFVYNLPDSFKISDGVTKVVLREGMKGILPEKIRNRMSKLGFSTPEEVWLKTNSTEEFRSHLKKAIESSKGILSTTAMNDFDDILSGKKEFSFYPWRLISFGKWMEKFNVKV